MVTFRCSASRGWQIKHDIINVLTHWGRVTHICVNKLTIIGSDNGLSPGRRQAIIWTKAGILLIGPLGTNFSEIIIEIYIFSFKKMHLKMSSGKWRPFCLGLNVLKKNITIMTASSSFGMLKAVGMIGFSVSSCDKTVGVAFMFLKLLFFIISTIE